MDLIDHPFQIKPGDKIFTVCSSGENRSQTARHIFKKCQNIELELPHAARGGKDPYYGQTKKWTGAKTKKRDGYNDWTNQDKVPVFGEQNFDKWYNQGLSPETHPQTLLEMRSFFSDNYYKLKASNACDSYSDLAVRNVFITFKENAHVIMYRLNEMNSSLENVVVLYYNFPIDPKKDPSGDSSSCPASKLWLERTRSKEAYKGLSKILKSKLDLSLVKNKTSL